MGLVAIILIIVGVIVLLVLYGIGTYNSLVQLRNRVQDQWAQIDVQLKKRFDLIPNLVETVKGYAKHERETLENVIQARNMFANTTSAEEHMAADGELTKTLGKLFALAENYPELKANTNFLQMQEDLKFVETSIAAARTFYNDTVLMLNNKVQMFPSSIIANMFKFEPGTFFATAEAERENIQVKF